MVLTKSLTNNFLTTLRQQQRQGYPTMCDCAWKSEWGKILVHIQILSAHPSAFLWVTLNNFKASVIERKTKLHSKSEENFEFLGVPFSFGSHQRFLGYISYDSDTCYVKGVVVCWKIWSNWFLQTTPRNELSFNSWSVLFSHIIWKSSNVPKVDHTLLEWKSKVWFGVDGYVYGHCVTLIIPPK